MKNINNISVKFNENFNFRVEIYWKPLTSGGVSSDWKLVAMQKFLDLSSARFKIIILNDFLSFERNFFKCDNKMLITLIHFSGNKILLFIWESRLTFTFLQSTTIFML